MSTTVVYVEHSGAAPRPASLEALGAAASLGGEVVAVLCGEGAADAAGHERIDGAQPTGSFLCTQPCIARGQEANRCTEDLKGLRV